MKLLTSKAGVTVLEGVIALGLLAVVTAGAFGVLLSAARKSTQPDMREEMVLAVEQAKDKLQVYINTKSSDNLTASTKLPEGLAQGLCGKDTIHHPLETGIDHDIICLLPRICDQDSAESQFSYKVTEKGTDLGKLGGYQEGGENSKLCTNCATSSAPSSTSALQVEFTIKCNGYEL